MSNQYPKICKIEYKYLRSLKLKNIDNNISTNDKEILDYLLDDRLVSYLMEDEMNDLIRSSNWFSVSGSAGVSGMSGVSGSDGASGVSGVSGMSGVSGSVGMIGMIGTSIIPSGFQASWLVD